MQKLIVTSRDVPAGVEGHAELLEKDPENRLLARGPRLRLSAETIRDQALLASGLLVEKLGGPSVMPYQPPRIWEEVTTGDVGLNGQSTCRTTARSSIAAACTRSGSARCRRRR